MSIDTQELFKQWRALKDKHDLFDTVIVHLSDAVGMARMMRKQGYTFQRARRGVWKMRFIGEGTPTAQPMPTESTAAPIPIELSRETTVYISAIAATPGTYIAFDSEAYKPRLRAELR